MKLNNNAYICDLLLIGLEESLRHCKQVRFIFFNNSQGSHMYKTIDITYMRST